MPEKSSIFEETYKNYLSQLSEVDLITTGERLGLLLKEDAVEIPFFGQPFRVSPQGVLAPERRQPSHAVRVVLCRFLLLAPKTLPVNEDWVSYKDFKDAAPFVGGYVSNTEKALVRYFSGRLPQLKEACRKLGGRPVDLGLSYQISVRFEALPQIPILLLFNDEDEEFPAQGTLLFQSKAADYLDMECLAILGWYLTDALNQAAGSALTTIM